MKAGLAKDRSVKDTRASYITNALDKSERMRYVIRQVAHPNADMLVNHYYRGADAPNDGTKLIEGWYSASILPE